MITDLLYMGRIFTGQVSSKLGLKIGFGLFCIFLVYIRGLLLLKGNTGPLRFDKLR